MASVTPVIVNIIPAHGVVIRCEPGDVLVVKAHCPLPPEAMNNIRCAVEGVVKVPVLVCPHDMDIMLLKGAREARDVTPLMIYAERVAEAARVFKDQLDAIVAARKAHTESEQGTWRDQEPLL